MASERENKPGKSASEEPTLLGPAGIEHAAQALADGELVAFPTETVYGLGADASSADAVAKIFSAKGRPTGHPLIVHLSDRSALPRFAGTVTPVVSALADAFWPGPLTIVVERTDAVAPETVGGLDTVGIRVPDHPLAISLLRAFGGGVAAPSANRFGSVSPTTAAHVAADLGGAVRLIIDGGPCRVGVESTIIDATTSRPTLLRPGGISTVELEAALGTEVIDGRSGESRAPGMLASHYAPDVAVELLAAGDHEQEIEQRTDGPAPQRVGLIAPFASSHDPSWDLSPDSATYGAKLYATLREADSKKLDHLLIVPPTSGPLLDAVIDRLTKAAAPRPATR